MSNSIKINNIHIGPGYPVFIIAEIGINHNGDIEIAKKLIDAAVLAGCDAVKFQKRTPKICVPDNQKDIMRETPWGLITYLEYRNKVEFSLTQYKKIDKYCREKKIIWFASCWDKPSLEFIENFSPPIYKISSACLTNDSLLKETNSLGKPIILSTGMSTTEEIEHAVSLINKNNLLIAHSTSSYPCPKEELNLKMINTLRANFDCPIGYSGHEVGLQTTYASVALCACFIERHITLDRAMWGTDQAASVEPWGLMRLVRDIRVIENALGDGIKKVYESEEIIKQKLRPNT